MQHHVAVVFRTGLVPPLHFRWHDTYYRTVPGTLQSYCTTVHTYIYPPAVCGSCSKSPSLRCLRSGHRNYISQQQQCSSSSWTSTLPWRILYPRHPEYEMPSARTKARAVCIYPSAGMDTWCAKAAKGTKDRATKTTIIPGTRDVLIWHPVLSYRYHIIDTLWYNNYLYTTSYNATMILIVSIVGLELLYYSCCCCCICVFPLFRRTNVRARGRRGTREGVQFVKQQHVCTNYTYWLHNSQ